MLLPGGVNNKIVSWRAKHKKVDVFLVDASGPISFNDINSISDFRFCAKKYPISADSTLDISLNASYMDKDESKITFDLLPIITDLSEGDYVYEVLLEGGDIRKTIVQDRFSILKSINNNYNEISQTLLPLSKTFTPKDISTNLTIITGVNVPWTLSSPSWVDTSTAGTGSLNPKVTVTDLSTNRTSYEKINYSSLYGDLSTNIRYLIYPLTIDTSVILFTLDNSSYTINITTDNANSWTIQTPSWLNSTINSSTGSVSNILSVDTSLQNISTQDVSIISDYYYDASIQVDYYDTIRFSPSEYTFSMSNLSNEFNLTDSDLDNWEFTNIPSWLSISPSTGYGDSSIIFDASIDFADTSTTITLQSEHFNDINILLSLYPFLFWNFDNSLSSYYNNFIFDTSSVTTNAPIYSFEDNIYGTNISVGNSTLLYHQNDSYYQDLFGNDWCVNFWFKGNSGVSYEIFGSDSNPANLSTTGSGPHTSLRITNGLTRFSFEWKNETINIDNVSIIENNWYNLCINYNNDSSTATFYIDASTIGSHTFSTFNDNLNTNLFSLHPTNRYADDDSIEYDLVRLFNRELVQAEIMTFYNNRSLDDYDWHWSFESQDTTDDSGNGYDGCFYSSTEETQATYPSGMVGSYSFNANPANSADRVGLVPAQHTGDPIDANITSKYTIAATDTFTICFKYKPNTTPDWPQFLFYVPLTSGGDPYLRVLHDTDDKLQLDIKDGTKSSDKGSTTLSNDQEYSIIVTYDGIDTGKLYLDGAEECSVTFGSSVDLSGNQITILNGNNNWLTGGAAGELDAVYFYPRVLSSSERSTFNIL